VNRIAGPFERSSNMIRPVLDRNPGCSEVELEALLVPAQRVPATSSSWTRSLRLQLIRELLDEKTFNPAHTPKHVETNVRGIKDTAGVIDSQVAITRTEQAARKRHQYQHSKC